MSVEAGRGGDWMPQEQKKRFFEDFFVKEEAGNEKKLNRNRNNIIKRTLKINEKFIFPFRGVGQKNTLQNRKRFF